VRYPQKQHICRLCPRFPSNKALSGHGFCCRAWFGLRLLVPKPTIPLTPTVRRVSPLLSLSCASDPESAVLDDWGVSPFGFFCQEQNVNMGSFGRCWSGMTCACTGPAPPEDRSCALSSPPLRIAREPILDAGLDPGFRSRPRFQSVDHPVGNLARFRRQIGFGKGFDLSDHCRIARCSA
jgi:hypothetical protein